MRVLLTGSHGYIGSVLTEELRRAGATVVGLDSNLYPSKDFLPWGGPDQFLDIDVRDVEGRHLDRLDAVIHLAALSNDPLGELDDLLTDDINHKASVHLAQICKEAGIHRFIFSSSCSIYGASDVSEVLDESAAFAPVTAYARSKVDTERDILGMADGQFAPIMLRNATAFGASPKMRFDLVLNNLFGWAYTTGHIRINSDGSPWRPLVHIRDIAQAAMLALDAPEPAITGQAVNVGDDNENHRVRDIGHIVQQVIPTADLQITGETGADTRSYRVDFQKLRRVLPAFHTLFSAQRGAQELLEVVQRRGLTYEEFIGGSYINVEIIKRRLAAGELTPDLRPSQASII